jgi:hypothetical protein
VTSSHLVTLSGVERRIREKLFFLWTERCDGGSIQRQLRPRRRIGIPDAGSFS